MEENSGSQNAIMLGGMSAAAVKEYIFGFIATLKMTEKEIRSLEEEAAKWKDRIDLARSLGKDDLLAEAEKEADRVNTKLAGLREEEQALKAQIDVIRQQLPGLAARERSIDPDLLEQELLMALDRSEEEAGTDRAFRELEKDKAVDIALETMKAKLKADTAQK